MTRLEHPDSGRPYPADPLLLDFEARLDLLVDNELSEEQRRDLLLTLEQTPSQWRALATRFLERQVERQAVKQLMAGAPMLAEEPPPTYLFRSQFSTRLILRNVAAILLVAALSAVGGAHFLTSPHGSAGSATDNPAAVSAASTNAVANAIPVNLPPSLVGDGNGNVQVQVPVLSQGQIPVGYPFAAPLSTQEDSRAHHVVIMPIGDNRAVVFPVTTNNATVH